MKWIRGMLALVSLMAMAMLFVWPVGWVVRWAGWLTSAQFLPAVGAGSVIALVAIVAVTLLCGRLYCAILCPLGIAQDVMRWIVWPIRKIARPIRRNVTVGTPFLPGPVSSNVIRYAVLVLFAVGVPFGFTVYLAPYGIFARSLVVLTGEAEVTTVVRALVAVMAVFVLGAAVLKARWWCNSVCPVGTLLGFVSRFAYFRVRIDAAKCVGCGLCAKACAKGAISRDRPATVDGSRCVDCFACVGVCGKGALRWR